MPEPAPTVQQLLAFYLEAGVDCALSDEPANRLALPTFLRLDQRPEVLRLAPGLVSALSRPADYYLQRRLFPRTHLDPGIDLGPGVVD